MRYHHEYKKEKNANFGQVYEYDHEVYSKCTLYKIGDKGLAVIQQRYDKSTKHTWWADINKSLVDEIYLHRNFKKFFDTYSKKPVDGYYPTMTIRQVMWALKMKPLTRKKWETVFDHKNI